MRQSDLVQQAHRGRATCQRRQLGLKNLLARFTRLHLLRQVPHLAPALVAAPVFEGGCPTLRQPLRCLGLRLRMGIHPLLNLLHRRHIQIGRWVNYRRSHVLEAVLGQRLIRCSGRPIKQPAQPISRFFCAMQPLLGLPEESMSLRVGLNRLVAQGHNRLHLVWARFEPLPDLSAGFIAELREAVFVLANTQPTVKSLRGHIGDGVIQRGGQHLATQLLQVVVLKIDSRCGSELDPGIGQFGKVLWTGLP